MHFKLGKSKEKTGKVKVDIDLKDVTADRIEKMEKRIFGGAKDLEEKTRRIQGLTDKNEDVPLGPHGPIGELTLEAVDTTGAAELASMIESNDDEDSVKVKLVEVSAVNAPPPIKASQVKLNEAKASLPKHPEAAKDIATPPKQEIKPETKKEVKLDIKPDDSTDSLGDLFNQNEEETNPLANLINSLPDVSVQELIDDLNDIKHIIREWQPK